MDFFCAPLKFVPEMQDPLLPPTISAPSSVFLVWVSIEVFGGFLYSNV